MEIELNERIGIDRSVLCNFSVIDVDMKKFHEAQMKNGKEQFCQFEPAEHSLLVLPDGTGVGRLQIVDRKLGRLDLRFTQNNLTGQKYLYANLQINVSGSLNNLQNLNCEQYQMRISEVFSMLENNYGVKADYASVRIKKIEINATFYLQEQYDRYRLPILLMLANVPQKTYNNGKNTIKFASWFEANSKQQSIKIETALIKTPSLELKIYNKSKHLRDIGELEATDRDIMRVEYTVKNPELLKSKKSIGSDRVSALTDEKINSMFKMYFQRDLIEPYQKWRKQNRQKLVELVTKHRALNQMWTSGFFRECRQIESVNMLPMLFDVRDLKQTFMDLEPDNQKNAVKKYRRLLKQAKFEKDLLGNTKRIEEIFDKILKM